MIRLLDPPLHEFLLHLSQIDGKLIEQFGYDRSKPEELIETIESSHEENPMLGLRGCRLAIVCDGLTETQVEAIMNAAADIIDKDPINGKPRPRIMIPLVGNVNEFEQQTLLIKRIAKRVKRERGLTSDDNNDDTAAAATTTTIPYEIGTMIEVPRAAIVLDQIARIVDTVDKKKLCQFFSYGTNDLTKITMDILRDNAGTFIPQYISKQILLDEPFKMVDEYGVGWLIRLSAAKGRAVNLSLSLLVCGKHGGDPASIKFFDRIGLDYISCSPYCVPIARLAKAQAVILRQQQQWKQNQNQNQPRKKDRVLSFVPKIV